MRKKIIAGIGIIAGVALCAAVWPRSAEMEGLPAEPLIPAVNAEIEAQSEEAREIFLSADTFADAPEPEPVAESEPEETDLVKLRRTSETLKNGNWLRTDTEADSRVLNEAFGDCRTLRCIR